MANKIGSGRASGPDAQRASSEASRTALEGLQGAAPSFGFVFASPSLSLSECLRAAAKVAGGAKLVGCTTAGEFTERGLIHGGVAVMLVSTESPHFARTVRDVAAAPQEAARALCEGFHRAADAARQKGFVCSTTMTLVDGLSGAGERFVDSIVESTQALHQVVGGAAGDEGKFQATHVGEPERAASDMAAAVHLFSRTPWGVGIGHGLEATTAKMRVTRAKGNVVHEIDGRPNEIGGRVLTIDWHADYTTLVQLAGAEPRLTGLRRGLTQVRRFLKKGLASRGDGSATSRPKRTPRPNGRSSTSS